MKYKLPIASDDELGGVKVGNDFEIDEDGTLNVKNMDQMQETVRKLVDNVGTGKALVAEAITEKGVETAEDATFQEMAGNIRQISVGVDKDYVDNADLEVKRTAAKAHDYKFDESVLPSIYRNKLYVYGNPESMYKASETGGEEPIYPIGGSEVSYNWWGQEVETWDKVDYKIFGADTDSGNNYNRLAIVKCVNPENPASSYYVYICPDYKYTITANSQAENAAISVINSLSHEYGATPKTRLWRQVYSGEPLTPQGYVDTDYANTITGGEIYDESTYNKYYNCRVSGIPLFSVTSNTQEAFNAVNTYIATGDASGAINYADINPHSKNSYCAIDVVTGDWYSIVNDTWVKQGTLDPNETGETEVEANPQGEPTEVLEKIRIVNTIYELPNSGGETNSKIITIPPGNGTSTNTFTFPKTPKKISVYYEGLGWVGIWDIIWGQQYVPYFAHETNIGGGGGEVGAGNITYGADNKSFTITGHNEWGAWNSQNGSGIMYVEYDSGSESKKTLLVDTVSTSSSLAIIEYGFDTSNMTQLDHQAGQTPVNIDDALSIRYNSNNYEWEVEALINGVGVTDSTGASIQALNIGQIISWRYDSSINYRFTY